MKRIISLGLMALMLAVLCLGAIAQEDVLIQIDRLEKALDNQIPDWRINHGLTKGDRAPGLSDTGWTPLTPRATIREQKFWIGRSFSIPGVFAGMELENSPIHLECTFRGVGKVSGFFYQNGTQKESFLLEFGNQAREIQHTFSLTDKASPGEIVEVAFRFENMGRYPVIPQPSAEPGAYLRIATASLHMDKAHESWLQLSRFLLDVKIGAILLDFMPTTTPPSDRARPLSPQYLKNIESESYQKTRADFQRALMNFDPELISRHAPEKLEKSLERFYRDTAAAADYAREFGIHIAGNAHIDLAWLWRWRETVEVARATFSTIMDNMEEYPDIVYIQSQAQAYEWMEQYYPEVFSRIQDKVKTGRWEIIGGMWAEPDCNLIDGESFIRQILYGKRYFKEKFDVDVKIGWNPDSFGYNWNMPQFFLKSGINSFVTQKISWNDTTVFPHYLFWWEAPDGSRILTYFPPSGYVGQLEAERTAAALKLYEKNTGRKDTFILYGLGDHGGGPNRAMLDRARDYSRQRIFPPLRHSRFSGFIDRLRESDLSGLPVWKDELYLEYHRGTYTTQAETKRFNRKSEVLLSDAEKISTLASLFGRPVEQNSLLSAWKKVLMNQFHDILPGSSINPVYKDARESYLEAHEEAGRELDRSLEHLASRIDTNGSPEGSPLMVFNTLAWERDEKALVSLPESFDGDVRVFDDMGNEIPAQILPEAGRTLCFVARRIPALGYRIYFILPGKSTASNGELSVDATHLENRFFRIELDPESGNISRITDKIAQKEIIPAGAQANQLQLLENIPDEYDAWNIQYTGREWRLDSQEGIEVGRRGPAAASLKVKKSYLGLSKSRREPTSDFPSSFFTQEIILYEDFPRIDIEMHADWWEDHVQLKVAFPMTVQAPTATFEIPFASAERPTTRRSPWEKARFEVPAIRWADLSDDSYGISLLNESKYGYDVKDNVMRLTLLHSPLSPDPMADRGKHGFAYALYPHQGDWRSAHTVREGYAFNTPLRARFLPRQTGSLPGSLSFFGGTPPNIIPAHIKKTEDRNSVVVRLYESEGTPTTAQLRVFRKPKQAYELDLMENRLRTLSMEGNELNLKFGQSEIKTIELVFD